MKAVIAFAFLLFVAIVSASVVQLNPDNINQVLQDNDASGVLVKFFAPWCGHCKTLAPEYEAAAAILSESGSKAVLAEADCDAHRSIGEEYGISGYPTLKFFKDGVVSAYNGGRVSHEIVSWIKRNSATTLETVETAEALAALKPTGNIYGLVVLFGDNQELTNAFLLGARTLEDIQFVHVTSSDLIAAEKATAGSARLYKQDGTTFDLPTEAEGILNVVTKNSYPKIVEFSQPQFQRLAASKDLVILGFAPLEDTAKLAELKTLLEAASDANDNVGFLFGDSNVFARGLSGAGASMNFLPTVVAIQSGAGQFVWDEDTPLNAANLQVWIGQVFAGNPPTNKKSEPVPTDNETSPVVKLVYKNYNEYFAKGTPIFVKYYAPWCGHCKSMAPDWVKLGETINKKDVIIADYDATANYAEVERVEGFPTLVFYDSQGGKEVYQGERTYDALLAFVNSKIGAHGHGHSHDEL